MFPFTIERFLFEYLTQTDSKSWAQAGWGKKRGYFKPISPPLPPPLHLLPSFIIPSQRLLLLISSRLVWQSWIKMLIAVFTFQPLRTTARLAWNLRGAIRCNLQRWVFFPFLYRIFILFFEPRGWRQPPTPSRRLGSVSSQASSEKDPSGIWSESEMKQQAAMRVGTH